MSTSPVHQWLLAAAFALRCCFGLHEAIAQEALGADARAKDRDAITGVMQSLVKTFEARDAKQLAALWTAEGEYQNDRGVDVQGREALEKAFATLFAKTPEVTAKLQSQSLRFLSADTAIEEGTVIIQRGLTEPTTEADYSALLVREDGNWLLAQLSDASFEEHSLEDLAWLIGEWKTTSDQAAEIRTAYSWDANKKFIHVHFTRKEKELTISGQQVVGVDPATGQVRAWVFEADGGIGESYWQRDGDHWTLAVAGTLADGRTIVETNVLRRIDDDTFTWQSIGRSLDDEPLPDLPPQKVTRVKTQ